MVLSIGRGRLLARVAVSPGKRHVHLEEGAMVVRQSPTALHRTQADFFTNLLLGLATYHQDVLHYVAKAAVIRARHPNTDFTSCSWLARYTTLYPYCHHTLTTAQNLSLQRTTWKCRLKALLISEVVR